MASVLSFALLVACGGNDDGPPEEDAPETHAEDTLAESLLLEVNDFPTGWSETSDEEEESPFDDCGVDGPSEGRTGIAETGDFSEGSFATITQSVGVFETPANAAGSLDRIPAISDCLINVVNDGRLDDSESEYSDAKFGNLSFPSLGDRTDAYRLEIHAEARGETGIGSEGTVYLDLIYVTEGRLAFVIVASDIFSPFDTSALETVVRKAHQKLQSTDA